MAFKIEKNVPMPMPAKKDVDRPPVADMEIGDSIIVSAKGGMGATNSVQNTARFKGFPYRFKSALVSDGIYRVWRIS